MDTTQEQTSTNVSSTPKISELLSIDDLDDFLTSISPRRWVPFSDWSFPVTLERNLPKVNIIDREKEVEVRAELPGINKEDLELSLNEQSITIRTTTKKDVKEEKGKYFRREISQSNYQRTLALPDNVVTDNVSAKFTDGILTVVIPKSEKSTRKTITVE